MVERLGLDAIYSALAHPIRRDLLELLRTGPRRVTDVAAPFDVSLAAVSKHVGVLEGARLLRRSVTGRDHVLAIEPAPLAEAGAWIDAQRRFWEGRLDSLVDLFREGADG